jgi:hypothetical protein
MNSEYIDELTIHRYSGCVKCCCLNKIDTKTINQINSGISSSLFTNRFIHGISDAKLHALDSNRGVERYQSRANRQLDRHHDRTLVTAIRRKLSEDPLSSSSNI